MGQSLAQSGWNFRAWCSVAGTSEPQSHRGEWDRAWRSVAGTSEPQNHRGEWERAWRSVAGERGVPAAGDLRRRRCSSIDADYRSLSVLRACVYVCAPRAGLPARSALGAVVKLPTGRRGGAGGRPNAADGHARLHRRRTPHTERRTYAESRRGQRVERQLKTPPEW